MMTERYLTTGSEHTIYIKISGNAKNKNSQINFGKKIIWRICTTWFQILKTSFVKTVYLGEHKHKGQ